MEKMNPELQYHYQWLGLVATKLAPHLTAEESAKLIEVMVMIHTRVAPDINKDEWPKRHSQRWDAML